jgi:hypothetical protein
MLTVDLGDLWMVGWDYDDSSTWYQLLPALDLPILRAFNRDAMSRLTESELLTIAERCDLHTLHLKPVDEVNNYTLHALPLLCPRLQELILEDGYRNRNSEAGVAALLQGCARTLRKVTYNAVVPLLGLLTSLGAHCSFLEELRLEVQWYGTMQDEAQQAVQGWEALTNGCPRLSILTAKHCLLTDNTVAIIAQGFSQLHTLWLEDNYSQSQLTDRAMHAIAQSCQNLHSLQLHGYAKATDTGICAVAAGCPHLRSNHCGDAPLFALAEHCRDLRVFHVTQCTQIPAPQRAVEPTVTNAGVTALVTKHQKLRELRVDSALLTDAVIPVIADNCKLLRELRLGKRLEIAYERERELKKLFDLDVHFYFR